MQVAPDNRLPSCQAGSVTRRLWWSFWLCCVYHVVKCCQPCAWLFVLSELPPIRVVYSVKCDVLWYKSRLLVMLLDMKPVSVCDTYHGAIHALSVSSWEVTPWPALSASGEFLSALSLLDGGVRMATIIGWVVCQKMCINTCD